MVEESNSWSAAGLGVEINTAYTAAYLLRSSAGWNRLGQVNCRCYCQDYLTVNWTQVGWFL